MGTSSPSSGSSVAILPALPINPVVNHTDVLPGGVSHVLRIIIGCTLGPIRVVGIIMCFLIGFVFGTYLWR